LKDISIFDIFGDGAGALARDKALAQSAAWDHGTGGAKEQLGYP